MNAHFCIGGPSHGKDLLYADAVKQGYIDFNCANRHNRSKFAQKRAAVRGEIIPPSMVWLHKSCFEGDGLIVGVENAS